MSIDETTVVAPGEIAIALASGRVELMAPLIASVKAGKRTLTSDEAHGILCVLRDQIKFRADDTVRIARMDKMIRIINDCTSGLTSLRNKLQEQLRKLGSNEPLEEDQG